VSDGLLFAMLPFITAAALGLGLWFVVRERSEARRAFADRRLVEPDLAAPPRDPVPLERPWWGSPWLWLAVCAVFLVLGLVVWPGLFGGTLIFLPFLWIGRPRRGPELDPRTNGHGRRGGSGSFTTP
jgi:hypothetical protein